MRAVAAGLGALVRGRELPLGLLSLAAVALVLNPSTTQQVQVAVSREVAAAPHEVQVLIEVVSEGGLVLLALTFLGVALQRWRASGSVLVPATTGAGVVAAYAISEWLKTLHAAPRPCWSTAAPRIVAECPPLGDWSLPSNHAAIAAGLGTAVVLLAPRLWPPVAALVLAVGAARVGLGVHYPHDVLDGFTVGAGVVLGVHACVVLAVRLHGVRSAPSGVFDTRGT